MNGFIHFADPALGTSLSFPGLGLELSLNREAVFIGPLTIYWYGIIVVTGIALGIWYAVWRAGQFGIDRDRITDVILYSVLAAIVGARLYYVAFSWDYYSAHPEEIIAVWKGGIAFYGGVIGALLCAAFLCRRWKLPLVRGTDAALGGLLLGQSIGRWGNFVNIEAFGGYFEGPWRMVSPAVDRYLHLHPDLLPGFSPEQVLSMSDIPVHPTFFYESAWTMLGFLFLVWYTKRRRFTGELTLFYFFWNGLGRAFTRTAHRQPDLRLRSGFAAFGRADGGRFGSSLAAGKETAEGRDSPRLDGSRGDSPGASAADCCGDHSGTGRPRRGGEGAGAVFRRQCSGAAE